MEQNFECVRDLMKEIERAQTISSKGKPDPLHIKNLYGCDTLRNYSQNEINMAVVYLVDKALLRLMEGQKFPSTAPRAFTIIGITGHGYDYLAAVREDTLWKKVKDTLGRIGIASVPNVISAASRLLLGI